MVLTIHNQPKLSPLLHRGGIQGFQIYAERLTFPEESNFWIHNVPINPRTTPGTMIPITNNIASQTSTNPVKSIDSGEDADPRSSTPDAREDNKTNKVADPGFVATAGVGNMT
jgi:hypothetical protein